MKKIDITKQKYESPREKDLMKHIVETSWRYKLWMGFLLVVILIGMWAYYRQVRYGSSLRR